MYAIFVPYPPNEPDVISIKASLPLNFLFHKLVKLCSAFFAVPLHPKCQYLFALTSEGQQYLWQRNVQSFWKLIAIYATGRNGVLDYAPMLEVHCVSLWMISQWVPSAETCKSIPIPLLKHFTKQGHRVLLAKLPLSQPQVRGVHFGKWMPSSLARQTAVYSTSSSHKDRNALFLRHDSCNNTEEDIVLLMATLNSAPDLPSMDWTHALTSGSALGLRAYMFPFTCICMKRTASPWAFWFRIMALNSALWLFILQSWLLYSRECLFATSAQQAEMYALRYVSVLRCKLNNDTSRQYPDMDRGIHDLVLTLTYILRKVHIQVCAITHQNLEAPQTPQWGGRESRTDQCHEVPKRTEQEKKVVLCKLTEDRDFTIVDNNHQWNSFLHSFYIWQSYRSKHNEFQHRQKLSDAPLGTTVATRQQSKRIHDPKHSMDKSVWAYAHIDLWWLGSFQSVQFYWMIAFDSRK